MRYRHTLLVQIALLGCPTVVLGFLSLLSANYALAADLVSDDRIQAIEVVHKRNIGQLHSLHHEMRATLKQLTRGQGDQEPARQLAAQLGAVRQALDTVAATEQEHPQWAISWSQRHARLVVLTQEMEALFMGASRSDGKRPVEQLASKLQEMKEILDIW